MSDRNFYRRGMAMRLGLIVGLFLLLGVAAAAYLATQKDSPLKLTRASAIGEPSSQNLFRNGGFERAELSNTWDVDGGADGKATITTVKSEVFEGKQAVKLFRGKKVSVKQSVLLPADQTYKIVGYFKSNADQPVLSIQVGNDKSPETEVPVVIGDASTTDKANWKSVTGIFSLPLSTYKDLYNSATSGLSVTFRIKTPGNYGTVIVDNFKLSLAGDSANLVQNGGFENWKSVINSNLYAWAEHDAKLSQDSNGNGGFAVNVLGLTGASKAPYIDQDVTPLVVKGADYTVSVDVKGSNLGSNTGWVSVSQQIPSSVGFSSLVKEAHAIEPSESSIDTSKPCTQTTDPNGILKTCRKFFTANASSWTNVSQMFHVDEHASRVWVNLAAYSQGNNRSEVSFDNVSMIYKPVAAPVEKPELLSPANGLAMKENAPTLQWTRMSGLGGNSNIDYYIVEVSDKTDAGSGGELSGKVFRKNVDQVGPNSPTVSVKIDPALTADGVYYWHVKAFNKGGLTSGWSDIWSFTVNTTAPEPVGMSIAPKLGNAMGKVVMTANWKEAPTELGNPFVKYVIRIKDSKGNPMSGFDPIEITDRQTVTETFDISGLTDGDYAVELKVVDSSGRGGTNSKTFSLYEDGFKKINSGFWSVYGADRDETVKSSVQEYLTISDHNDNVRPGEMDDLTGLRGGKFTANQFDISLDFVRFSSYKMNDNSGVLTLLVPQGNEKGYETGIIAKKSGYLFEVVTGKSGQEYTTTLPSFPFNVRVNMGVTGEVRTYLNGSIVNSPAYNITGKDFGGLYITTNQRKGNSAIDASFDNFRMVWVK